MRSELPCFTCPLPDCDDRHRLCGLRRGEREYENARRNGLPMTEELRAKYSMARREFYTPQAVERARVRELEVIAS